MRQRFQQRTGTPSRRTLGRAAGLLLVASSAGACESTEPVAPEGNVLLGNQNNYTSVGSLSIPTVQTASGVDLELCWSDVVTDIQCHEVQPTTDLDNVALLRVLNLDASQVEQRLAGGGLAASEVSGYIEFRLEGTETCTQLSSLSFLGTAVDVQDLYVENDTDTYMLLVTEGTNLGVGARTMAFLEPSTASTNTRVDMTAGCGLLDFQADLTSLQPVSVNRDGPWVVDWRQVTRDSIGGEVSNSQIDSVIVGYYAGMSVSEVEAGILDLELMATALWEVTLPDSGSSVDLALAVERTSGERFSGFTPLDGVWAFAALCSTCQNPAPIILTIFEPDG